MSDGEDTLETPLRKKKQKIEVKMIKAYVIRVNNREKH